MKEYRIVGLMSGTSLDGVDIALCSFNRDNKEWQYKIVAAETIVYNPLWKERLQTLHAQSAEILVDYHFQYGTYLGELVKHFLKRNNESADFVASHGHTIFHQPSRHFTFQLGEGASLCVACELPVVCDFRTMDVALGGQGAPLVPIGDKLLFNEFDYCLNLGGIANISFDNENKERIAFDICPCNLILNHLANQGGKDFDENGNLAAQGKIIESLLAGLNNLDYYKQRFPKSLGREDIERVFLPKISSTKGTNEDKLRTVCEHIAMQIAAVVNSSKEKDQSLLITGGGSFNKFLVERIQNLIHASVILPEKILINYKEAVIFAFLGFLRWEEKINCLRSVTGAKKDSIAGAIYYY